MVVYKTKFLGIYQGKNKAYKGYPIYEVTTDYRHGLCVERDFEYLVWIAPDHEKDVLANLVKLVEGGE